MNSQKIHGIKATSSGIHANIHLNEDIAIYAKHVLEENNILSFTPKTWTKTTKEILEKSDVVVFMQELHLNIVKERLNFVPKKYFVWDISDINEPPPINNIEKIEMCRDTYKKITHKVDELIELLGLKKII